VLDLSTLLTPAFAFLGALLACVLTLRAAGELERRSMREETTRNVRWAAELAVSADPRLAKLGVLQLNALNSLPSLDVYERTVLLAAVDSMEPVRKTGEGV
jgi:hypothetical protein